MLVTLAEYKSAIKETSSANDQFHQDALDAAASAVLVYTDRDFGTTVVTGNKSYWYNGSGVLNIDDAATVNSVTMGTTATVALPGAAWIAKTEGPPSIPVYTYLELPVIDWSNRSVVDSFGVMGFTANLDQWLLAGSATREVQVTVNAAFGWPTVPPDVKRATIFTAKNFEDITPSGGAPGELSSKSVAEVSESWFAATSGTQSEAVEAIPAIARALLNPYTRVNG